MLIRLSKGKISKPGSQESGLNVTYDWDKLTPFLNVTYSQLPSQLSLSHNTKRFKMAKETISSLKSIYFLLNEQILWALKASEIPKTAQTFPL